MTGSLLFLDAASPDKADRAALADVSPTPAKRKGGGWYPQSPEEWDAARAKAFAMLERARAEGRYSDDLTDRFYCSAGRHFCDGIVFAESGGGQGVAGRKEYCRACFDRHRPAADPDAIVDAPAAYIKPEEPARPSSRFARPTFADICCLWASTHYREAFEAFARVPDGVDVWAWESRVLAAIVRKRADQDVGWLLRVVVSPYGEDLILIGDYVKRAGGYPVGDAMTFPQWVRAYRLAYASGVLS